MSKSKKYFYDGDVIWNSDAEVDAGTLLEEILADEELGSLDELIVGCWGESYDNGIQPLIDGIVAHADKFRNIKRLFIGDMDYEECEVSWIEQGDYSALWAALPELRSLTVKGSTGLSFGSIRHEQLEELEVICGGLPSSVIRQIAEAKLPRLKKLNLYLGVENYGFDGSVEDIRALLNADFIKQLEYLGLGDSEIQDEVVEAFFGAERAVQDQNARFLERNADGQGRTAAAGSCGAVEGAGYIGSDIPLFEQRHDGASRCVGDPCADGRADEGRRV